jgi:hypothetical protein
MRDQEDRTFGFEKLDVTAKRIARAIETLRRPRSPHW